METFASSRSFVDNPRYTRDRARVLGDLDPGKIDESIRDLVVSLNDLPCCFTLQCCHGHFVYEGQTDPESLAPLPADDVGSVRYRIAYLALAVENSPAGRRLRDALASVAVIDPEYVQFGSPDWFWRQHVNSYALQVEPARFAGADEAAIDHQEALHVQDVRDAFFVAIERLMRDQQH